MTLQILIKIQGNIKTKVDCDLELKFKDQFGNNIAFFSKFLVDEKYESIENDFIIERRITLPSNMNSIMLKVDVCVSKPGLEVYLLFENAFEIDYIFTAFVNSFPKETLEKYLVRLKDVFHKQKVFVTGWQLHIHSPEMPRNVKVVKDYREFRKFLG